MFRITCRFWSNWLEHQVSCCSLEVNEEENIHSKHYFVQALFIRFPTDPPAIKRASGTSRPIHRAYLGGAVLRGDSACKLLVDGLEVELMEV